MPIDSPLGGLVTGIKELRIFNVLVCPRCGSEFASEKVKMFGIFRRTQLWIPFAGLLVAFGYMVWHVRNS